MNCDNRSSFEDLSINNCSQLLDVCCDPKDVRITPKPPMPTFGAMKCGLSNPNGVGIKIKNTMNDHEAEFGNI